MYRAAYGCFEKYGGRELRKRLFYPFYAAYLMIVSPIVYAVGREIKEIDSSF